MRIIGTVVSSLALLIAAPAVAAPVSMTFQNVGTTGDMKVSKVQACGVFSPTPVAVAPGKTSPTSSTDCGSAASAAHVTYAIGTKTCVFHITTTYTAPNPLLGQTTGTWTPYSKADGATNGAICKVVSQDVSDVFTTGAFAAVFSMK